MGTSASVQTTVNNLTNTIKTELNQSGNANASASCTIDIGSIKFIRTNGCTIRLVNDCKAKAAVSMESIQKAVINFYNNLDNTQKQEAPSWFTAAYGVQTTVNNIVNDFTSITNQKCSSSATIDNNIKIGVVEINECNAPANQIMSFDFINAGHAEAICIMKAVNDIAVAAVNDVSNKQSQGIDWSKLLWPIVLAVIVISVLYIFITVFSKAIPSINDKIELEKIKKDNYVTRIRSFIEMKKELL